MAPLPLPATFFQRTSAWLFDVSLALWPASLMAWVATGSQRRELESQQAQAMAQPEMAMGYLQDLAALYFHQGAWTLTWVALIYGAGSVLAEGGLYQATWGKRLMGISVEAMPGSSDSRGRVAMRFAAGSLSWLTLNWGHAMARWRKDGRALHDMLTGMQVIQETMTAATRRKGAWVCWGVGIATHAILIALRPADPVLVHLLTQLPF